MERTNHASTCRWAVPTLFFAPPIWLYAWDAPWTCIRGGEPRVLGSTDQCGRCPRLEPPAESAQRGSRHQLPDADGQAAV
jgi:hypothetical protein